MAVHSLFTAGALTTASNPLFHIRAVSRLPPFLKQPHTVSAVVHHYISTIIR